MSSQHCPHCGELLPTLGDAFCTFCQEPLIDDEPPFSSHPTNQIATPTISKKLTDRQRISKGCKAVSRGLIVFAIAFLIADVLIVSSSVQYDGSEPPPAPAPSGMTLLGWGFVYLAIPISAILVFTGVTNCSQLQLPFKFRAVASNIIFAAIITLFLIGFLLATNSISLPGWIFWLSIIASATGVLSFVSYANQCAAHFEIQALQQKSRITAAVVICSYLLFGIWLVLWYQNAFSAAIFRWTGYGALELIIALIPIVMIPVLSLIWLTTSSADAYGK